MELKTEGRRTYILGNTYPIPRSDPRRRNALGCWSSRDPLPRNERISTVQFALLCIVL